MSDKVMIYLIVVLLLIAWVLRFLLAKAKGETRHPIWVLQGLVFPIALVIAEIIFETTEKDYMFGVIVFCIVEELICWGIRKKSSSPEGRGTASAMDEGHSNESE